MNDGHDAYAIFERIREALSAHDLGALEKWIHAWKTRVLGACSSDEEKLRALRSLADYFRSPEIDSLCDPVSVDFEKELRQKQRISGEQLHNNALDVLLDQLKTVREAIEAGDDAECRKRVEYLDKLYCHLLPVPQSANLAYIRAFAELMELPNFGKMESCGTLLGNVNATSDDLPPDVEKSLCDRIVEHFPAWTSYAVCYNALERFVFILPPEEALDALEEVLQRPMCYGADLVPDALLWLYFDPAATALQPRIREALLSATDSPNSELARAAKSDLESCK